MSLIRQTLADMGVDLFEFEGLFLMESFDILWRAGFSINGTPKYFAFRTEQECGPIEIISKIYKVVKEEEAKYATV